VREVKGEEEDGCGGGRGGGQGAGGYNDNNASANQALVDDTNATIKSDE
jgi:hypothetical protein